jgi:hypothetical protein
VRCQLEQWTPARVLKGDDAPWSNQRGKRAHDRARIGQELQNESPHNRIEKVAAHNVANVRFHETHMVKPSRGDTAPRLRHYTCVTLDAYDLSRGADQPSYQHGDIADAGADLQNALAWAYARIAEQAFGEGVEDCRLSNQTLVFGISVPEYIGYAG